jgi:ADP-ribosylglycohydrolase
MIDCYRGCLLGLAAGDALGATLEFRAPGTFQPIDDMIGRGVHGLEPGQWTDDTSMALCLAESLIECETFDPLDQLERYVRWWRDGHLSSTGDCFDIGNTVCGALQKFVDTGQPCCGPTDPMTAGNGSIMRLAPVPMFYADRPREAVRMSGESSRTTHGARECVDACRYFGGLIVGALKGAPKHELLADHYEPVPGLWADAPLAEAIDEVAGGSFKRREPPEIKGTGYVVKSLEAALWAFWNSETFKEGALLAVNLGDDADTTGAVYGQLAGAHYGMSSLAKLWLNRVAYRLLIETFAEKLHDLARSGKD